MEKISLKINSKSALEEKVLDWDVVQNHSKNLLVQKSILVGSEISH